MIRKHLRLKRLVLGTAVGLAIAAISAPAVLAKPTKWVRPSRSMGLQCDPSELAVDAGELQRSFGATRRSGLPIVRRSNTEAG